MRRGLEGAKLITLAASALLAACALGPNFATPTPPDVAGYTPQPLTGTIAGAGEASPAQRLIAGRDIPGDWWTIFHSHALNDLITDALAHNADLQAAQDALRVAYQNSQAAKSAFFPQLSGNFTGTGGQVSNEVASPLANNATAYTLYTPQVTVSYTPDVFGGIRRQVESEEALSDAQRFELEATYLTLTSNVVTAAIQEASLRGQIAATKRIITIGRETLNTMLRQRDLGEIADADVLLQKAALAQIEETLPPLDRQLAQQRDLLTALAGRFPSDEVAEKFTIASLQLPRDLPLSLPSQLVEQRPDIEAAEANLHSASALVGVAIANRLPVLNLTSSFGNSSENLATLFTPQMMMWSATGSVTQTIFDGFSLYHKQKAAEAALDEAKAQYRSTVVTAFQNVADVLRALQSDAKVMRAAVAAETATQKSLDVTRKQLELGQVNYLALLNAQQAYFQASVTRIQAQALRLADTAALFQALGGGWWNRSDVAASVTHDDPLGLQ